MTNELETDALLPLSLPVLILPGQPRKVGTASTRPAGSFCLGCMSLLDHHYLKIKTKPAIYSAIS